MSGSSVKPSCIVISGSRDWPQDRLWLVTAKLIEHYPYRCAVVVTGGAEGVDQWANKEAERLHYPTRVIFPDYERYGRYRAPLERNIEMLELGPELVLAFQWRGSPGTGHTIREARRRGIPVLCFTEESLKPTSRQLDLLDSTP